MEDLALLRRIRWLLILFVAGLALSGLTAFALPTEVELLHRYVHAGGAAGQAFPRLAAWLDRVHAGIEETAARHPFLFYGTDWLAFAHLVIAVAFIGPLRDPVRNRWVIQFGMIACALVIPLAMIAGLIREIPFFWRLIDCSFGIIGIVPLVLADRAVNRLIADTRRGH